MENLSDILKRAGELQDKMQRVQGELDRQTVVGDAGGGLVKIEMNGRHDVINVTIDDLLMDDREVLEDLVAGAINDAVRRVDALSQEKLTDLTRGLNIPLPSNWP